MRHPVYLPSLVKAAEEHDGAITTIASIPTPEATTALINLASNGSSVAASLLPGRLPHPNFKKRDNWNEAWSLREQLVKKSWRNEFADRARQVAWRLLEATETEPYEERKKDWMLGGSILFSIGRSDDFARFLAAASPIVESLGTVDAEQRQYPSPLTVIANFVSAGDQLIRRGARPGEKPQTAFESMMFVTALRASDDFRPDGWQTLARRLMRHSMPRVRSTCVASLPVPTDQQFVDPIIELFSDSSPLVAATALNSVGAAKDSRFLESALKVSREAEDKWVQGAARHAAGNCRPVEEPKPKPVAESSRSSSAKTDAAKDARLNLLRAQIVAKQAELERARRLFKRGFVTDLEVKKLELELASLTKTLAAERDVSRAEKLLQEADARMARRLKAEARLKMLEAQIVAKRTELDRAKLLLKRGLINRLEVDKLEFELQAILATKKAEEHLLEVEKQFKAAEEAATESTLKVKLTGESIAGFPLLFQLDVTNHTKKPFEYWCGGPGLYPNASMFVADITDSDGESKKVVLHNGQYVEGSGVNHKVEKEASLPAACDPLPPGKYTITVSCGPTAVLAGAFQEQWPEMKAAPISIEIRDEPQAIQRASEALLDLSAKSPFAKHVARTYGIAPIVNEWLQQLLDDDPREAFKVVGSLSRCRRLPKGGDEIVVQAAKKHLSPFRQEKNLLRYISMIARNVGNATTLEATMAIALGDVDNYARRGAVNDLAEFSHPVAEKVLEKLAENPESPVYWSAIEALATKKNQVALKALLDVPEPDDGDRRRYFATMLKNFPDDPEAQKSIQRLLNPKDETNSNEEQPREDSGDSAGKNTDREAEAAADAVSKLLARVPWSKPINGLRVRATSPKTAFRLGDVLPLHAQLQNATQEPIPFSKLSRQCRVRVNDAEGNWVGIARDDFGISPWEGRAGKLKPGEIIQWTMNLERRRFNKSVKPGSTLPVTVSVPSQIIEPGKLPRTEYSRPVRVRFDQVPDSNLKASDFSDEWSRQTTIVYREMGGLFGPSRVLRIDGSGLLTAVRPESRNPPKEPLLPLGRTTMQLPQERLDRIAKLLSTADLKTLGEKSRIANPDEPVFLLSISVGGRTLSGSFPWGVVRDSADLTAIQKELREVMTFVKSNVEKAAAQADQLTKTRGEKLLANADSFMLQLYYYGPTNKPYYRLHLQTQPVEPTNFFTRSHQLSKKQLEKLLDGLAREGFLRNGNDQRPPKLTYKEGYILYLSCKDYQQYEVLGFADNKEMLKRLIGLHPSLEGDAARSMSLLLGRMGVRAEELPKTEPVKREPLPKQVRLRVFRGDPSVGDAAKPIIDQPIETGKPFDLKGGYISVAGKLFRAVTGRPRFKATIRFNGGTNEFDAEIKLGKPLRSYGGGFSGGILTHFVRLDPVK